MLALKFGFVTQHRSFSFFLLHFVRSRDDDRGKRRTEAVIQIESPICFLMRQGFFIELFLFFYAIRFFRAVFGSIDNSTASFKRCLYLCLRGVFLLNRI